MESYLGIKLCCGHASYAEMPNSFDVVLGVTGTLKALSKEEAGVLQTRYNIKQTTHMPSVYGKNKLRFAGDNPTGKSLLKHNAQSYRFPKQVTVVGSFPYESFTSPPYRFYSRG